jgi:predicted Rossmann fold flavoprotein
LDKNREPGVKILISGGSRCNLTHATDARGIVAAFGPAGRFLHSAVAALGPQQVVDWFEAEGVPTKVEAGGKVFPTSDRASDVRAALVRRVRRSGCTLALGEPLVELATGFRLVTASRSIEAANVILATGGQSYPACGATGDGYRWAAALGHRIVPPRPALVPVTSHAPWVKALQGVTLPDVLVWVVDSNRVPNRGKTTGCLASSRGAMLFAHFGVTGPAVMDVSHAVSGSAEPSRLVLRCDLLPDVPEGELDAMLAGAAAAAGNRRACTLLDPWLPHRIGETLLGLTEIPTDRPLAELSKADRRRLAQTIKRLDIPVSGTMGFRKAEVTAGGVALEEVDSRTMQSRIVPNLYFAGEILDLNGPVGGYNFQAAFSTGWLAGESA